MKTIYTMTNDGRIYKINQNVSIPSNMVQQFYGANASVTVDAASKTAVQSITVSTLKAEGEKSNRELYVELCNYIREHKITEIDTIQNNFRIYIEYETFDGNRSMGINSMTTMIAPIESIVPLGTATNSENVYRHVKDMKTKAEFVIKNSVPFGVMSNCKREYVLVIRDIAVFQNFSSLPDNVHKSTYNTPYGLNEYTSRDNLEDMTMVYSTASEGLSFAPLKLNFIPRKIAFDLELLLTDYIVAYDTLEIDRIIKENIRDKYHINTDPVVPDPDSYPHHMIPRDPTRPAADGSVRPDKDGHYDYYERCKETSPDALLVVEDDFPDGDFNENVMIRKKDVILDIPDIKIGEYVRYVEGFISQYKKPHHHHHRPPCPPCPHHHHPHHPPVNEDDEDDETPDDVDDNPSDTYIPDDDDEEIQIDASEVIE